MRNAVSWAGSLFRALSLEVSLTLTGSLRTPLRRDAWSLSALHKACQACLLTVCGRVRAGQRDRLSREIQESCSLMLKEKRFQPFTSTALYCMCFMCLCSLAQYFFFGFDHTAFPQRAQEPNKLESTVSELPRLCVGAHICTHQMMLLPWLNWNVITLCCYLVWICASHRKLDSLLKPHYGQTLAFSLTR